MTANLLAVTNAAPNKVFKEDGISNHIIKLALSIIMLSLARGLKSSTMAEYCSKHFRKSITVSLCKPNKLDYSISNVYRLITLFNTIGKIMESTIATRFSFTVEAHNILP